ncbi:MAG: hypothetical protein EOO09_10230 [Chitinophagaceae bacterium]|nr:MAG: hypothetical protein EOO09_10230 [Chitinophagaceae bacterium]
MKVIRFILPLAIIAAVACNNNKKEPSADGSTPATTAETPADTKSESPSTNTVKEYKVKFASDTAILGKQKDLLVSIKGGTAIALTDPDGKDTGIELTIRMTVTNKAQIGQGSGQSISYSDSRLQLDNGTSITAETGTDYLRADPEATSKEETWTYKVPAGAKPKAISLFKDDTRVTIGVTAE